MNVLVAVVGGFVAGVVYMTALGVGRKRWQHHRIERLHHEAGILRAALRIARKAMEPGTVWPELERAMAHVDEVLRELGDGR